MTQTASSKKAAAAPAVSSVRDVARFVALTAVVVTVILIAFGWPSTSTTPHDVKLAVAGPDAAVAQVAASLDAAQPGVFDVVAASSAADAQKLVEDREAAGAIVLGASGPESVIVASYASPALSQVIQGVANGIASAGVPSAALPVTDVAPLPESDPRGFGIPISALPLAIAGIAIGAAFALQISGTRQRLLGATAAAALAGVGIVAVLHGWFGTFSGNLMAEYGLVVLGILATAFAIIGFHRLIGVAGVGVVAATVMLLGTPISGAGTAPQMVPAGWAELGQALPPGAITAGIRSVAGFDGVGAAGPILVLSAWALGGLALAIVGARRASAK